MAKLSDPTRAFRFAGEFRGVEGARGWLSWTVVFSHVVLICGIPHVEPELYVLLVPGQLAVQVFVIMSGFVITHALLTKQQTYKHYIYRRAFRLFPSYLVCLIISFTASFFCSFTLSRLPWGETSGQGEAFTRQIAVYHSPIVVVHLLAHLSLLHGLLSDEILRDSEYMFLAPAWSLSLEWQFYLVAPLIVFIMRRTIGKIVILLISLLGLFAFHRECFGTFWSPSILPGAALQFAAGILTRLYIEQVPKSANFPTTSALLLLMIGLFYKAVFPYMIWYSLVAYITTMDSTSWAVKLFKLVLDSRTARLAGLYSYSVYLIHWPIVMIGAAICVSWLQLGPGATLTLTLAASTILTLAASALIYRYVERPGIQMGKLLTSRDTPHKLNHL